MTFEVEATENADKGRNSRVGLLRFHPDISVRVVKRVTVASECLCKYIYFKRLGALSSASFLFLILEK